jgi:hypothetical protein
MRESARLAVVLVLASAAGVLAKGPDPEFSSIVVSGQSSPCQFRFRADGGGDVMTVSVTMHDVFDWPVANCSTYVSLTPTAGTLALCSCDGLRRGARSDAEGHFEVAFDRIGGRGSATLCVTSTCMGNIALPPVPVQFTSADLDGSCSAIGAVGTVDLGIWSAGLPPAYQRESDYDCNGVVNVMDLGLWVAAMGVTCAPSGP